MTWSWGSFALGWILAWLPSAVLLGVLLARDWRGLRAERHAAIRQLLASVHGR